jgi:hypothetical protein
MKDPILEEVRRAKRKVAEEERRDPVAYREKQLRRLEETCVPGPNGIWYPKPQPPPADPVKAALDDAWTLPRVARKIRRRKILAKAAAERFENARRILAAQKQAEEAKKKD